MRQIDGPVTLGVIGLGVGLKHAEALITGVMYV
jgi:hypothetical protein